MAVTHLHPLSRGSIVSHYTSITYPCNQFHEQHINTTSIDDHPIINPNFIESEFDKWFLAKATAHGRKFFQTKAFSEIFESEEVFPGGKYYFLTLCQMSN